MDRPDDASEQLPARPEPFLRRRHHERHPRLDEQPHEGRELRIQDAARDQPNERWIRRRARWFGLWRALLGHARSVQVAADAARNPAGRQILSLSNRGGGIHLRGRLASDFGSEFSRPTLLTGSNCRAVLLRRPRALGYRAPGLLGDQKGPPPRAGGRRALDVDGGLAPSRKHELTDAAAPTYYPGRRHGVSQGVSSYRR